MSGGLRIGVLACALLLPLRAGADEPEPAPLVVSGSVSCGAANRGSLQQPAIIADRGPGWVRPSTWARRGARYGTDELVGLLRRAAARVADEYPGSLLGIADLSREHGGAAAGHRSHQSGRDADLLYYAIDEQQRYVAPDSVMPYYTRSGKASYAKAPTWTPRIPVRYFDLERNWALIRALLEDQHAEVISIFVASSVKYWLIKYAEEIGAPAALVTKARHTVVVPRNVGSHNDHLHIRVACSADDRLAGRCRDELAPSRKRGKHYAQVRCPAPNVVLRPRDANRAATTAATSIITVPSALNRTNTPSALTATPAPEQ
ncbi:MAG TPA: penicillin-insensitive murein endopeptidase [Kofleriaceae bacterium]|nr:penicillin-insensitive murein endopeptidase [Kofleriaceae bacterium]